MCELCGCDESNTFHHLIPQCQHKSKWTKKNFTKAQMAAGLNLCSACHKVIHKYIPNKLLARNYNTKERIIEHPKIKLYLKKKK